MAYSKIPLEQRFWSRVKKTDGCWLWTGSFGNNGYGQISESDKNLSTHRVSWELHYGPIPDGMSVLHQCDNKQCVRPDHLFLGSRGDNNRDRALKGRSARGEHHGQSKLTQVQVIRIRQLYSEGLSDRKIAKMFSVARHTIREIVEHRTWTWVEP